ncbi:dynamin family protein [Nocardioides sp.]|uniref:dynamin family protein n=1 Tax=Nocardioides sp. TaxID=35761 RepID=UPI003511751A
MSARSLDARMVTALVQLRQSLVAAPLPFELPETAALAADRARMIDQLEDYLIPRMATLEAPLLVVVGGSTGAGKSTLVNSLVGERVTVPGVLRPTTRSPVLVHHPEDAGWFGQDRLLPELVRVDYTTDDPDRIQLVPSAAVPRGLAILDAPDVDSVEERNRLLATQLLAAADLWLFVTSAARYSDQVPWEHLRHAADRNASVAIVLDRTADDAVPVVRTHLARMLAARGLKDSPLFCVADGQVDDDGLLPAGHVAEIRRWLESLAADADARQAVVRQTLEGAVRLVTLSSYPIADAVASQHEIAVRLHADAVAAVEAAAATLAAASADGTLLRGDLLARWREFLGGTDLLRPVEGRVGGLRERLVNTLKGKPQQAERVLAGLEASLVALVAEHAERVAGDVAAVWEADPAGAAALAADPDLRRASRDLPRRTERAVRAWQEDLAALVRDETATKRTSARFLALGVSGLSVVLAVLAVAGEPDAGAAEPTAAGRALLDSIVGASVSATLIERARRSWEQRVTAVLHDESARYLALVDGLVGEPQAAARLREAARRVDDLRFEVSRGDAGSGETA